MSISNLEVRQSQLRNSRDVNISLVKSMELTLKKCIMKLRRKLDERSNLGSPSLKTLTGTTSIDISRESESILYEIHPRNETLQESVDTSNAFTINDKDNSTETTTTTTSKTPKKNDFTDNVSKKPNFTSGEEDDLNRKHLLDGDNNIQPHENSENNEKSNQTKIDLKLICRDIILENIVDNKLHTDDLLLRRIWSQNSFPYQDLLSKENTRLHDSSSMFPLFSLIQPKNWLFKMIDIINIETIAKIKLNRKETLLRNYVSSEDDQQDYIATQILKDNIRETCLDIFAQIKYIPFLSQINQIGSMEYKPAESLSNHNEDCKILEDNVVHGIDPNVALCPYELAGVCADDTCPFQHLKSHKANNREQHQSNQYIHASTQNINDRMTSFLKGSSLKLPNLILPRTMTHAENKDLHDADKKRKVDFSIIPHPADAKANNLKYNSESATKKMRNSDIGSVKPPKIDDEDRLSGISEVNLSVDMNKDENTDIGDPGSKSRIDLTLDTESDYIALPEIKHQNEDNDKVSDKIPTLHGSDVDLSHKNLVEYEWYNNNVPNMKISSSEVFFSNIEDIPTLSNFLSFFGFKVCTTIDKPMDGIIKIQCIAKVVEECNSWDKETQRIRQYILDFEFFGRLIDAIRLCLNAGRFDLCRSLVVLGEQYLAATSSNQARKDQTDIALFKNLLETLNTFVENNFVGYGSTSFYGCFKSQVALSILSSFLMTCHETISYHKVSTSLNKATTKKSRKLDELISRWKSLFGACQEVLQSLSSPYTTAGKDEEPDSQKESFGKNIHTNENTKCYRRIVSLMLSNSHDAEKCFENLLQSATLGSSISHSIIKLPPKQSEIGSQQYFEENIIPLYDYIKSTTAQMVEHHSTMNKKCSIKLSKLSLFTFFAPIVIAHFSVFCMLLKDDNNIKSKTAARHDIFGIGTFNNGALAGAIKLFKSTIRKLQKVESDLNLGHRLLMVPLFSFMVSLSICSGNISEAQQTLSEILFHSNAISDNVYSKTMFYVHFGAEFYSELLWSQLIQLRISFPLTQYLKDIQGKDLDEESMHNKAASNDKKQSTSIEHELAQACVYHEINLWKVLLPGDSNFVRNMNSILKTNIHGKENKSECVAKMKQPNPTNQIRQICKTIVTTLANNDHDVISTKSSLPHNLEQDVILQSNSLQLLKFPSSILLLGLNLKHLQLIGCGLNSIPETIGYVCPNIQVCHSFSNYTFHSECGELTFIYFFS